MEDGVKEEQETYLESVDVTDEKRYETINEEIDETTDKIKSASDFFPIRRMLARFLDFQIYNLLIVCFFMLVLENDIFGWINNFLDIVFVFTLTLLFEPILICLTGTTIGKFIMGISIKDKSGKRIGYVDALKRTCGVLVFGLGLQLPIIGVYAPWKSYISYKENGTLPWEGFGISYLRDNNFLRFIIYFVVMGFMIKFGIRVIF